MIPRLFHTYDENGVFLATLSAWNDDPESLIGSFYNDVEVRSYAPDEVHERRIERDEMFAMTIDRMNGAWYATLTDEQKVELQSWRQGWLDYPATGVYPPPIDWFVGT